MFERYTESAGRVLFFGRYEVTQLAATSIETEPVLFGLTRESTRVRNPPIAVEGRADGAVRPLDSH